MKKKFILLLLLILMSESIILANSPFQSFIENFRTINVPFEINENNWEEFFYPSGKEKIISEQNIIDFICRKKTPCQYDMSKFNYLYSVKYHSGQYIVMVIKKLYYEYTNEYDVDIAETIFLVYDKEGQFISYTPISKDGDRWTSDLKVENENTITVRQIKFLGKEDSNKKTINALVCFKTFTIDSYGKFIEKIISEEPGIMQWDNHLNRYKLSEK